MIWFGTATDEDLIDFARAVEQAVEAGYEEAMSEDVKPDLEFRSNYLIRRTEAHLTSKNFVPRRECQPTRYSHRNASPFA
jgi:hypothetical protein